MHINFKNRILMMLLTLGIIFAALGGLVIWDDPLFQYRNAERESFYQYLDATYQNPGIAKNTEYDSTLIGSSITQNFDPEYASELFGERFVKLSYSGANSKNNASILKAALDSHPDLKRAVISLDDFAFYNSPEEEGNQSPKELLDFNKFNDLPYIFNKDIIFQYTLTNLVKRHRHAECVSRTDRFTWYGFSYGDAKVLSLVPARAKSDTVLPDDAYLANAEANLELYWRPVLESHGNTEFDFFLPPYSIMHWYEYLQDGHLDAAIEMYRYIVSRLLEFENVRIYGFSDSFDVITNLYNYKDQNHYHYRINDWMLEKMVRGEKIIESKEDCSQYFDNLKSYIEGFDFNKYYDNPLLKINDLTAYLEALKFSDYLVFLLAAPGDCSDLADSEYLQLAELGLELSKQELIENGYSGILGSDQNRIAEFEKNLDGLPYSNNGDGISLVVWSCDENRIVDAVSFASGRGDREQGWSDRR